LPCITSLNFLAAAVQSSPLSLEQHELLLEEKCSALEEKKYST